MNEQAAGTLQDSKKTMIELLRSRSKKTRFVTEVSALLQRANMGVEEVERALAELEAEGAVMIRDHYCADPHLASVDLRIVAVVDSRAGADPQLDATRAIDRAWDKWLADARS